MPKVAGYGNKIDDYKSISIKNFKDRGYMVEGPPKSGTMRYTRCGRETGSLSFVISLARENPYVRMVFSQNDDASPTGRKEFDYKISLKRTPCNYGGWRYWFICPCTGRVCTKLYLQNNGWFCDRKAMKLFYESEVENKRMRAMWKVLGSSDEWELYKSIKYPYRSGKPTRKYQKFLKRSKITDAQRDMVIQDTLGMYKK